MESKRKNILTLILIIVIVIIAGIIGYIGFELINENVKQGNAEDITDEFDDLIPTVTEEELAESESENVDITNEESPEQNQGISQTNQNGGSTSGTGNKGTYTRKNYSSTGVSIGGYWVVGTIRIPATGIKYSIFSQGTPQALERGVGQVYTSNGLNQPGDTVIAGHNYRNRLFFSRNKNLKDGDKIIIKDTSGVEVTYSVYYKFITTSSDATFYERDTGGQREITLTTCTDQGTKTGERYIIYAREV